MFVVNFHTDNHSLTTVSTQKHTHTKNKVAGLEIRQKIQHYSFIIIFIYESRWIKSILIFCQFINIILVFFVL